MMKLNIIDDSNRSDHFYLTAADECYFWHEFTARKGYAHSPGNQFILNFKKSPSTRHEPQYQYKLAAIEQAITLYRGTFEQDGSIYQRATFVPVPPSKVKTDPLHDDRMLQLVKGICSGKNADVREFITQTTSYEAAHSAADGNDRIKPTALQSLYRVDSTAPKSIIALFDDVLSAGCHFRAAKSAIQAVYPDTKVIGFFLARRVPTG